MESVNYQCNEENTHEVETCTLKQNVELGYTEPIWARVPPTCSKDSYYIEVIKDGVVIERISLHNDKNEKSYLAIGRFDPCEIKLQHPSVSRFHSILQYGELTRGKPQWFIYDMNSTHGVRVNKKSIEKQKHIPLLTGFVFQIAASSRIFVLCGGPKDDLFEGESNLEMLITKNENNSKSKSELNKIKINDDKEVSNYRYYEKDPLHWLERYFEREGVSMNFQFTKAVEANDYLSLNEKSKKSKAKTSMDEDGSSTWICSIELISDVSLTEGTLVSASAPSKRLAQLQCSLLACERLESACLLQISTIWNKRKNYTENDFYAEDEDLFYDRTGQLEEQREKRKRWYEGDFGANQKAKTHNDLLKELEVLDEKLLVIRSEIERLIGKDLKDEDFIEENVIRQNFSKRMAISQLKIKEKKLMEERSKTDRLVEISRPNQNILIGGTLNKNEKEVKKEEERNVINEEYMLENKNINENFDEKKIEENEDKVLKVENCLSNKEEINGKTKLSELEQIKKEEKEPPKFYAPAMPPKSITAGIPPRFGILTKQELVQMKLLQRQGEKNKEALLEKRRRILIEEEERKFKDEMNERIQTETEDMYDTWLPPDNQSGDGSTQLNKKFAGKY